MIDSKNCPECGAEIIFIYQTPERSYRIENGTLVRDDNNITDNSELNPYCSNDREHVLEPPGTNAEFWTWSDSVEQYFLERGLYEI
ncbi:MAG: hypothetical protein ACFFG0_01950 [Candidatus Thorarchaeota archaeon]